MNPQVIASPQGQIGWVPAALPGAVHDLAATWINPQEQRNSELRHRTDVVGLFPGGATPSSASWRRPQALRLNRRAARVTAGCIKVGFPESYGRESAPGWTVTEPGAQTGSGMRRADRTV